MLVTLVAGARPNFMKISPIIRAIDNSKSNIEYRLVHTGQHYDKNMSQTFFDELGIPEPHINLESGGGTQAEQTAKIMIGFERDLMNTNPNIVLVVGDVTSTLACSIAAKKLNIPVAHVEGGIRSGDMTMPEEVNRIVTDSISDFFFTTTRKANENLIREGKKEDQLFFVGNTMIDTLLFNKPKLKAPEAFNSLNLKEGRYLVLTLHRPNNVDAAKKLETTIKTISRISSIPVIFPIHPRTKKQLNFEIPENIHLIDPLGYLEFNFLVKNSHGVITDSGGITEETTVLGIPCITLRDSTERPETVSVGTNELIGTNPEALETWLPKLLSGKWKDGGIPELWDGKTSERIVSGLLNLHNEGRL